MHRQTEICGCVFVGLPKLVYISLGHILCDQQTSLLKCAHLNADDERHDTTALC